MRIVKSVLILLRIGVGLVGCVFVLQAVFGILALLDGAPWVIIVYSGVYGLAGYLLAYGAFHHFPWDRPARPDAPAA